MIPILSITIFIPLFTSIFILLFIKNIKYIQLISISAGALTLLSSILMLVLFDNQKMDFQFIERYSLMQDIGLEFFIGVDGMSLLLICLMSFLGLLSIIYSLYTVRSRLKEFIFFLLLLQALVISSFAALNLLLFYIFFELSLVPMYMMIGLWGGEDRIYASFKFFIYTFVGSVIFLVCIMYFYSTTKTLSIPDLYEVGPTLALEAQKWLWLGMFITFAIKIPMFPFHTWLPDAHVQAPTVGSVILAGVLLKLGGYGFLRILLPILPQVSINFAIYPLVFSVIAIIYASFAAMAQKDMKKMIAYSSIAHMGYVTAGIFSLNQLGINGSIFQMLSHGLVSGALFFSVGSLYERTHTKQIDSYSGVATKMPFLAACFMIFTLASIGLPGTSGFVGEFLCLNGIFAKHHIIAAFSTVGILLSAIYMLGLYKKVMFGTVASKTIEAIQDLSGQEKLIFASLVLAIVLLGILPNMINQMLAPSIQIITKAFYVV
jgi:NADH-quinone oxidoreductase subunit M